MQNISTLGHNARILASDIGAGNTVVNVTNGGQFFNNVGGNINMTSLSNRLAIGIVPSILWSLTKSAVVGFVSAHPIIAMASVTGLCCAMAVQCVRDAVCKVVSRVALWVTKKQLLFDFKLLALSGIATLFVKCLHRAPCTMIGAISNVFGVGGNLCKVLSSEYVIGRALSGVFGTLFQYTTGGLNYCLWLFGSRCVFDIIKIGFIKYGPAVLTWLFRPFCDSELEAKPQGDA